MMQQTNEYNEQYKRFEEAQKADQSRVYTNTPSSHEYPYNIRHSKNNEDSRETENRQFEFNTPKNSGFKFNVGENTRQSITPMENSNNNSQVSTNQESLEMIKTEKLLEKIQKQSNLIDQLRQDQQDLIDIASGKDLVISCLQQKLVQQENQVNYYLEYVNRLENFEDKIKLCDEQLLILQNEIQYLNRNLQSKSEQCQQWRYQFNELYLKRDRSSFAPDDDINIKVKKIKKICSFTNQFLIHINKLPIQNEDIYNSRVIKLKDQQINFLKAKMELINKDVTRVDIKEDILQYFLERIGNLSNENSNLKKSIEKYNDQTQPTSEQINNFQFSFQTLHAFMFSSFSRNLLSSKDIDQNQISKEKAQNSQIDEMAQTIKRLERENVQLQKLQNSLESEIRFLKATLTSREIEISQMKQQHQQQIPIHQQDGLSPYSTSSSSKQYWSPEKQSIESTIQDRIAKYSASQIMAQKCQGCQQLKAQFNEANDNLKRTRGQQDSLSNKLLKCQEQLEQNLREVEIVRKQMFQIKQLIDRQEKYFISKLKEQESEIQNMKAQEPKQSSNDNSQHLQQKLKAQNNELIYLRREISMDPYQYQPIYKPPMNGYPQNQGIPRNDSPIRYNNFGQPIGPSPRGTQMQISPPRYNNNNSNHLVPQNNQRVFAPQQINSMPQIQKVQPNYVIEKVVEKPVYIDNREEIQKLLHHIDSLTKVIHDKQNENANLRNFQAQCRRLSQENQYLRNHIEELMKIINSNDGKGKQIAGLTNELERLNNILRSKVDENENLKNNLRNSESHRNNLENQNRNLQSLQSKVSLLENELNRLREILDNKTRELDDYQMRYIEADRQISDYQDRAEDLEKKNQIQYNQIERLSASLRKKMEETDELRIALSSMETRIRDIQVLESQLRRLQDAYNQKVRENQELRNRLAESRNLQTQLIEYENQIVVLSTEIQRLNSNIKLKNEDIEALKNRNFQLQSQLKEFLNLDDRFKQLQEMLHSQNMEIEEWKRRLNEAESDNRQLVNQMKEYETRYNQVVSDNERLNDLIRSKLEDLDLLRNRYSQQEQLLNNYRNLEPKLQDSENQVVLLSGEIERLNNQLRNKNDDIEGLRRKILENEGVQRENNSLKNDVGRLQDLLAIRNKEIDEWQSKFTRLDATLAEYRPLESRLREFEQEINRLNQVLRNKIEDIEGLRTQNNNLEREIVELKYRAAQAENLISENERLTQLLRELQSELDHWRYKYAEYSGLQSQNTELLSLLVLTNVEVEGLRARINSKEYGRDFGKQSLTIDNPNRSSSMNKYPSSTNINKYNDPDTRKSNSQYGQYY